MEWIDVKDELPKIGAIPVYSSDWVIAFDGTDIYMAKYIKLTTNQFWKELHTQAPLSITHWMPLPQPPSSSNKE